VPRELGIRTGIQLQHPTIVHFQLKLLLLLLLLLRALWAGTASRLLAVIKAAPAITRLLHIQEAAAVPQLLRQEGKQGIHRSGAIQPRVVRGLELQVCGSVAATVGDMDGVGMVGGFTRNQA
jgi:hypothetical protein